MSKKIILIILTLMLIITGCDIIPKEEGNKEVKVDVNEYIKMANDINTQINSNNEFSTLKTKLNSMKDYMTDKVYDNNFNLDIPYIASTLLIEGYEKIGYEVLETIVNQMEDEDGKIIVNVYIVYNLGLRVPKGVIESGSDAFDVGRMSKFVFSNGKLIDFQIIL